jgi:hypothetical protein
MESPVHFVGFSRRTPVKVLVGQEDCKPGAGNSLQLQCLKPLYVLEEVVPTVVMGALVTQIVAFSCVLKSGVACPVFELDSEADIINPNIEVAALVLNWSVFQPDFKIRHFRLNAPCESVLEIRLGMEDGSPVGEFGHDVVNAERL